MFATNNVRARANIINARKIQRAHSLTILRIMKHQRIKGLHKSLIKIQIDIEKNNRAKVNFLRQMLAKKTSMAKI